MVVEFGYFLVLLLKALELLMLSSFSHEVIITLGR